MKLKEHERSKENNVLNFEYFHAIYELFNKLPSTKQNTAAILNLFKPTS